MVYTHGVGAGAGPKFTGSGSSSSQKGPAPAPQQAHLVIRYLVLGISHLPVPVPG